MTTEVEMVDPLPQIDDGAATGIVLDVLRKESALRSECQVAMEDHPHLSARYVVGVKLMKFAIKLKTQTQRELLKAMEAKKGIDWTQVIAFLRRKETRPC